MGRLGPAAGAVTGHVQQQIQRGRDGQADRGPTDHVERVVNVPRRELLLKVGKPSMPVAPLGRAHWAWSL
jgi:hypothetical protein